MNKQISRKEFLVKTSIIGLTLAAGNSIFAGPKCDDTKGLKPDEIKQRKDLKYTDNSPNPKQNCANCALYVPPKGGPCGGCNLIKGPVSPEGWCTSWVAKG